MRLDAIGPLEVRAWVVELNDSGLAPATVHKAYQTLAKVLRAAADGNLIAESPCRRIPLPRIERNEMRFLSPDEIAGVAGVIAARYRALVLFDAYCGLRLSELAGLRRAALDLGRARVRVTENAVEVRGVIQWGAPKTRAGRRTVPIPASIVEVLDDHLTRFSPEEAGASLVFAGADGGVLRAGSWRSRFWAPATRAAGVEGVRIHDLRHTVVSLWIAAGASPKQIATWAGHTSVSVVLDRYGHLYEGHESAVLDRLDAFAGGRLVSDSDGAGPRVFAGFSRGTTPTGAGHGAHTTL